MSNQENTKSLDSYLDKAVEALTKMGGMTVLLSLPCGVPLFKFGVDCKMIRQSHDTARFEFENDCTVLIDIDLLEKTVSGL